MECPNCNQPAQIPENSQIMMDSYQRGCHVRLDCCGAVVRAEPRISYAVFESDEVEDSWGRKQKIKNRTKPKQDMDQDKQAENKEEETPAGIPVHQVQDRINYIFDKVRNSREAHDLAQIYLSLTDLKINGRLTQVERDHIIDCIQSVKEAIAQMVAGDDHQGEVSSMLSQYFTAAVEVKKSFGRSNEEKSS